MWCCVNYNHHQALTYLSLVLSYLVPIPHLSDHTWCQLRRCDSMVSLGKRVNMRHSSACSTKYMYLVYEFVWTRSSRSYELLQTRLSKLSKTEWERHLINDNDGGQYMRKWPFFHYLAHHHHSSMSWQVIVSIVAIYIAHRPITIISHCL